jgi:uncharacterized membrane protein YdjX (TVP38/TMEM64 family)
MDRATRRQLAGVVTLVVVAAGAALVLSPAGLARSVASLTDRPLQFAVLLVGAYGLRFLVAWPISALSVVVGFALGPLGIPVALAGAVGTCVPPYLLAGRVDPSGALGRLGGHGERYFTAAGPVRGVTAARLAPLPADGVSYAAGLAGLPLRSYLLGTALGELPWVTAAVLVGASAETLTMEGLAPAALVVGAAGLAVLLLAPAAYRAVRTDGRPT